MKEYTFEHRLLTAMRLCGCVAADFRPVPRNHGSKARCCRASMAARLALFIDRNVPRGKQPPGVESVRVTLRRLGIPRGHFYSRAIPTSKQHYAVDGYYSVLSDHAVADKYRDMLEGIEVDYETEETLRAIHKHIEKATIAKFHDPAIHLPIKQRAKQHRRPVPALSC